jgi:K+-transporting ATPase KdpF subunit
VTPGIPEACQDPPVHESDRSGGFIQRSDKRNAGRNLSVFDADLFRGGGRVREILRRAEVKDMLDTIVSLAVCAGLLIYLVYAMLRPEKF